MARPFTRIKTAAFIPSAGFVHHDAVQNHIGVAAQEPGFKNKVALISFNRVDLDRLFGNNVIRSFYTIQDEQIHYIALKPESANDGDERFGNIVKLNQDVMKVLMGRQALNPHPYGAGGIRAWFPATLLMSEEEFDQSEFKDVVTKLNDEEYKSLNVMRKWDYSINSWVDNTDEIPVKEKEPPKPKLHLKDIPLTTRANRNLLRDAISANAFLLNETHQKTHPEMSFNDWMIEHQQVQIKALIDLSGIDALPDAEYVEAMVKFKQAEVTGYHNVAVQKGETEEHLFDWCLKNFGEEFHHLGRKAAETEINMMAVDEEIEDDQGMVDEPAVFVVSFDGTIVENQYPIVGPLSPFSIDTLKALKKNGHRVIILTRRWTEDDMPGMLEFFKNVEFVPDGYTMLIRADEVLMLENCSGVADDLLGPMEEHGINIDYLINHMHFGAPMLNISGNDMPATFLWTELIPMLQGNGYLSEEDVAGILGSLEERMHSL